MTTQNRIAAVDPGEEGAVAIYDRYRDRTEVFPMYEVRMCESRYDFARKHHIDVIYVEELPMVHSAPAILSYDFGGWFELLCQLDQRMNLVAPKVWQRTCQTPILPNYQVRKQWLHTRAKELFPGLEFDKPEADALLILHHVIEKGL